MTTNDIPDEYMHCFNVADDFFEGEPMELESEVPDVAETVELEWHQWQPGQDEPGTKKVNDSLGIKALVKLSDFKEWKIEEANAAIDYHGLDVSSSLPVPKKKVGKEKSDSAKVRGQYRTYSPQQVQELLDLVTVLGMSARQAGLTIGINVRTAQYYVKKYRDDDEKRVPLPRSAANLSLPNNKKLFEVHTDFLCKIFDTRADLTLIEARSMLLKAFPEIYSITLSALHKHLVNKASITLKKLDKIVAPRDSETTISTRHDRILEWKNDPNMDWSNNCVFVDEAGFNLHIRRNFGRSSKGKPARVIVPPNRGVSITIVGAICELGIIDLSLKRPQAQVKKVANSKKRKLESGETEATTTTIRSKVGTRTEHFLYFLAGVMDELDRHGMTGRYIVMDNAPIHKNPQVSSLIEERGYKAVYLPPYSPFLNPIEEFWSKVKAGIKRETLTVSSNLSDRIVASSRLVTVKDCQGWIRHAYSFFDRCLNRERML